MSLLYLYLNYIIWLQIKIQCISNSIWDTVLVLYCFIFICTEAPERSKSGGDENIEP